MTKIHEFDPVIYPCKLWIAIHVDPKLLSDTFCDAFTRKEIDTSFIDLQEAATYYVEQKESPKKYGILIATTSKYYFTTKLIAHESTHGAEFMWNHVCELNPSSEANAYLVGWIAECCEKVRRCK